MKFHNVHGSSVTLTENRTIATRSESNFCNGIVFSDQPFKLGQKISIEIDSVSNWSGALRAGVTLHDPGKVSSQDLPKYAVPELTKKDGYWVRPISESLAGDGAHLMFYLSPAGHLQFFVNNEHKGALFAGLPTDKALWILFDLYGNTRSARCVQSDDAPNEILARGPEAVRAFEMACSSGMRPVYRTRLMIVGQDGVGKTSLLKAMAGQGTVTSEENCSGVSCSTSCCFSVGHHDNWTVFGSAQDSEETADDKQKEGIMEGEDLEEEYHHALATNIVQELMYQKRLKAAAQKPKTSASKDNRKTSASKKLIGKQTSAILTTKFSDIPSEMFSQMPDRVVELVQKLLDEKADIKSETKSQDSSVSMATTRPPDGSKVVLDLWDFSGKDEYQTTQSLLLSSRAVYIVTVNLLHDLESTDGSSQASCNELSPLESLDFWLRFIFAHASTNVKPSTDSPIFSPPILIVGTHRDSLNTDIAQCEKIVENKFEQIRDFVVGKPYVQHLITPFFAVDCETTDDKIRQLCMKIEEVSCQESYMGEKMPIRWIQFEHQLQKLVAQGFSYASYDQVRELAGNLGITDSSEITTMLEFYHDLGLIIYYDRGTESVDNLLRNIVILRPQWLIEMFDKVLTTSPQLNDKWSLIQDKWSRLEEFGILEEPVLDLLWKETLDQKLVLIGLLEKFDLMCQRLPGVSEVQTIDDAKTKAYYVPSRLRRYSESKKLYTLGQNDVTFFVDFHGFFPAGLFNRILTKTVRWSQEMGGKNPYCMYRHVARFFLDTEHDFVLEMSSSKYSRLKVVVLRVSEPDTEGNNPEDTPMSPSSPHACAKIRNFLESCLCGIREMWMKRLSFTMCVPCPCERVCEPHKKEGCSEESCIHFLNLDECLANKIVCCEHRRVKTAAIKKCFPEPPSLGFTGPVLPHISLADTCGNIEKHCPALPNWVKGAAKLLNTGEEGQDWKCLAKELGYKQNQINYFNDDMNPGLALLADWIITSGNTGLAVDMLSVYLEKLDREDVVEIIQKAQESEQDRAQIFLSYQWDSQDEVKALRDKLERSGFMCWMDIGQLGGGDQLYNKIDEALRHCKMGISNPRDDHTEWNRGYASVPLSTVIQRVGNFHLQQNPILDSFSCTTPLKNYLSQLKRIEAHLYICLGKNTRVVVACVTPKYVVSHHCIKELALADLLHKPIIPVMIDKVAWPPPGGMSLIFSQLVYINMKGVGGHGGTGIHADKNDKYKEIIQRISLYAVPDLSKCNLSETDAGNKNPYNDGGSIPSMDYSVHEIHSGLDELSSYGSLTVIPTQRRFDSTVENIPRRETFRPAPEVVQVTRCRVCTIL